MNKINTARLLNASFATLFHWWNKKEMVKFKEVNLLPTSLVEVETEKYPKFWKRPLESKDHNGDTKLVAAGLHPQL